MQRRIVESRDEENQPLWSRLTLGDALTADTQLAEIEEQFSREYEQAGRPVEMALFKRHDTEHSLHCVVTVYFSPAARRAANASGAVVCRAPSRANLELMVGDRACWTRLFGAGDSGPRNPARDTGV
jgi:hypothetical protein